MDDTVQPTGATSNASLLSSFNDGLMAMMVLLANGDNLYLDSLEDWLS